MTQGPQRLYLVRHAKAEGAHPGGDAARRLTAEGRERFQALLGALAPELRGPGAPARIRTSPFVRTRETARLLAAATGASVEEEPLLASGRSGGRDLLALALEAGAGAALVGHNPEIAEALALLAAGAPLPEVKPGTIAAVDLLPEGPRLAWVRTPPKLP